MNILNRCHFRSWLRCSPFISQAVEFNTPLMVLNFQEPNLSSFDKRFLSTSTNLLAGHSKWANIKHTKGLKDQEKSLTFAKYGRLIRMACKESGGSNPKLNFKLARVMEQARSANMPTSSIEFALKSAEKSEENSKPGTLVYSAPGGMFVIIDLLTDNIRRSRNEVTPILKKVGFKEQKSSIEGVFEEKGIILAKGDMNKALDDAIEVGAEDVTEEDNVLTFTTAPADFYAVRQGISNLDYDILYAGVEQIPNVHSSVKEAEVEKFKKIFDRLQDLDDVIKLHYNFEL